MLQCFVRSTRAQHKNTVLYSRTRCLVLLYISVVLWLWLMMPPVHVQEYGMSHYSPAIKAGQDLLQHAPYCTRYLLSHQTEGHPPMHVRSTVQEQQFNCTKVLSTYCPVQRSPLPRPPLHLLWQVTIRFSVSSHTQGNGSPTCSGV